MILSFFYRTRKFYQKGHGTVAITMLSPTALLISLVSSSQLLTGYYGTVLSVIVKIILNDGDFFFEYFFGMQTIFKLKKKLR